MHQSVPAEATQTSTKVLQHHGKRIPIRLEHIFWLQLQELAAEAGIRMTKYVHQVLGGAGENANRASVLRCHCLKAARDAKTSAFLSQGDVNLTLLLTACPSPAFILKDERTIVAHNPAFATHFMGTSQAGGNGRNYVRISYARPFSKLREFLVDNPSKALNSLLVLSTGGRTYNCRARLILVGPPDDAFVMAFFEVGAKPLLEAAQEPGSRAGDWPAAVAKTG